MSPCWRCKVSVLPSVAKHRQEGVIVVKAAKKGKGKGKKGKGC
jgi:hypothetical protein